MEDGLLVPSREEIGIKTISGLDRMKKNILKREGRCIGGAQAVMNMMENTTRRSPHFFVHLLTHCFSMQMKHDGPFMGPTFEESGRCALSAVRTIEYDAEMARLRRIDAASAALDVPLANGYEFIEEAVTRTRPLVGAYIAQVLEPLCTGSCPAREGVAYIQAALKTDPDGLIVADLWKTVREDDILRAQSISLSEDQKMIAEVAYILMSSPPISLLALVDSPEPIV